MRRRGEGRNEGRSSWSLKRIKEVVTKYEKDAIGSTEHVVSIGGYACEAKGM